MKISHLHNNTPIYMAEGEGFEPSDPLQGLRFSRPVHSTWLCDPSIKNNGGAGGIRTLAPVSRPTPLAGEPLKPLEYRSKQIWKNRRVKNKLSRA